MEKHDAAALLRAAVYSPTRLFAIHSGVLAGFALTVAAISHILGNLNIGDGLGAMGLQATLTTVQASLWLIFLILLPIWNAGLTYAAIGISRGRETCPNDLTEGFRKLRPLLIFWLLASLQYACRFWISDLIVSTLVQLSPFGIPIIQALNKIEFEAGENLAALSSPDLLPILTVFALVMLVTFVILACPLFYRYRMSKWLIMDGEQVGGIPAMFHGRLIMQRRRQELAKLDLHFWWYYLLIVLGIAISMGGVILPATGLSLPFSGEAAFWIFLCAGLLILLSVKILAGPAVAVTYALRYERYLNEAPPEPPAPKQKQVDPKDLPWNY